MSIQNWGDRNFPYLLMALFLAVFFGGFGAIIIHIRDKVVDPAACLVVEKVHVCSGGECRVTATDGSRITTAVAAEGDRVCPVAGGYRVKDALQNGGEGP